MLIYLIRNTENSKVYIGKHNGNDFLARWRSHIKNKADDHFRRAIRKYGVENFSVESLAETNSLHNLNELEKYFIYLYCSYDPAFGYNKTLGGDGVVATDEIRQKLSQSAKGRVSNRNRKGCKLTQESCQKISEAVRTFNQQQTVLGIPHQNTGRIKSPETCEKISKALKGKPSWSLGKSLSPDHCLKLSESHRGLKYNRKRFKSDFTLEGI